jgi:hypothetical protein
MNKQIEDMRKDIYECDPTECYFGDQCEKCPRTEITKALYEQGYRRQSDTAREIFAELKTVMIDEYRYPIIEEIKKKYEVTKNDD